MLNTHPKHIDFHLKKRFGQNFLVDGVMLEKLVNTMRVLADSHKNLPILEIGPGIGALTKHLLEFENPILALEIDFQAIARLNEHFAQYQDKLSIQRCDALDIFQSSPADLPKDFVLLSNLPFNVGSRILVELAINFAHTDFAVILQKQVAEKTSFHKGFTFFGAWLNLFWDCKTQLNLAPNCFYPQPRVWSSLLSGKSKNLPEFLNSNQKRSTVKTILKELLKFPSKTLANNLKNLNWNNLQIETFLQKYDYTKTTRLEWQNYAKILQDVLEYTAIQALPLP